MAISSSSVSAITGSEDATAKISNLTTGKASVTSRSALCGSLLTPSAGAGHPQHAYRVG